MSEPTTPLLELRDVTAGYARDIDVLREIDLRVDPGRIAGLIGLNGAGKSPLVKTVCGFLPPKSGSVHFRGEDISGTSPTGSSIATSAASRRSRAYSATCRCSRT